MGKVLGPVVRNYRRESPSFSQINTSSVKYQCRFSGFWCLADAGSGQGDGLLKVL